MMITLNFTHNNTVLHLLCLKWTPWSSRGNDHESVESEPGRSACDQQGWEHTLSLLSAGDERSVEFFEPKMSCEEILLRLMHEGHFNASDRC